jgi:hypothetical protein
VIDIDENFVFYMGGITMKKLIVFFIMSMMLFIRFVEVDAAIICPYAIGIEPSCGTINDQPSTATQVSITSSGNKTVYTTSFNQSRMYYYKFTAPYSGYYDIFLSTGDKLTNAYLLNSNQTIIDYTYKRMTAQFLNIPVIRGETYYIKVYVPYSTVIPMNLTIYSYDTNTKSHPHTFNIGSTTSSSFEYVGDVDYFKISQITGVISIYATNYPHMKITLMNQDGVILGETNANTPVIAYYIQSAYTYIIKVEMDGYKGSYSINSDFY